MFLKKQNYLQKVFIYTDASFNPLEGFASSGFLFFASEIEHQSSTVLESSIEIQSFKVKNNIRAEMIGANHCLKRLIDEIKLLDIEAKNLEINLYSDCQTLTNILFRREKLTANNYISGKKKTELANADLYKIFYLMYDELKPNIFWVKGHSKSENQSLQQKKFQIIDRLVRNELRGKSKH